MIPKDLRYSKSHEWVRIEGDTGTVGITKFAVEQLTDVVYVELPKVGKQVKGGGGDAFGQIESVKAVSDLYAPVSGEITAVNDAVVQDPSLISADPYGKGWMVKIKLASHGEVQQLLTVEQYEEQVASQGH